MTDGTLTLLEDYPKTTRPDNHRKTSDRYGGVIFRSGRYRVAVCCPGIQWLYQSQRPGAGVGAAWDKLDYSLSRNALIQLHREHTGARAPEFEQMPEHFSEWMSYGAG